jgi:hypothetical protein
LPLLARSNRRNVHFALERIVAQLVNVEIPYRQRREFDNAPVIVRLQQIAMLAILLEGRGLTGTNVGVFCVAARNRVTSSELFFLQ